MHWVLINQLRARFGTTSGTKVATNVVVRSAYLSLANCIKLRSKHVYGVESNKLHAGCFLYEDNCSLLLERLNLDSARGTWRHRRTVRCLDFGG